MKKNSDQKSEKKRELIIPPFFDSLNCAIEGIVYVSKTQRNMRLHILIAIFVVIVGLLIKLDGTDFILVCLAILMVLFSEMINTAIELQVDLISQKYHPIAKNVKDICAGSVLLSSVFAVLVGYLIVAKKFDQPIQAAIHGLHASPWNVALACLGVVAGAAILMKFIFHRGTPLHGGMPSGHTAIAFSIWMLVTLLTSSTLISALTLFTALIVAQSRISLRAHTVWEVAIGGALGALITLAIYQIILL